MEDAARHPVRLMRVPGEPDRLMLCYPPGTLTESEARHYLDELLDLLAQLAADDAPVVLPHPRSA